MRAPSRCVHPQIAECRMKPAIVVDLLDEAGRCSATSSKASKTIGWTASTFSVLMKLILAGEVDRLIAEAEALQSQLDGKCAVLRLLESQLKPGSSERGRVSMALSAPSPAGQYYRRHLALGPWRAAQEAAARDAVASALRLS